MSECLFEEDTYVSTGFSTRKTQLYAVFATPSGGGNLAAVVGDTSRAHLASVWQRQAPVAVCIDSATRRLRFFTQAGEMKFCGHGILAGVSALAAKLGERRLLLTLGTSATRVTARCSDGEAAFETARPTSPRLIPEVEQLHAALGIDADTICRNLPQVVASAGSRKAFVPVRSLAGLERLAPRMASLRDWSRRHGVNGAYVYSAQRDYRLVARGFNPLGGVDEDAATASAAAALVPMLDDGKRATWEVQQGSHVGRPCIIRVSCQGDITSVGGRVSLCSG